MPPSLAATAPAVLAVGAHPDDIEFLMAGTLLRLRDAGWRLHYLTVANGSCGTATESRDAIVARRRAEAIEAARCLGAVFHESLVNDLEILYTYDLVARVLAVVREACPRILLVHSADDYMEDHSTSQRLAVTAAFCRGMVNYVSAPARPPVAEDVTIYHAMPAGLRSPLRERVRAGQYVDTADRLGAKRAALGCHRSQKEWLDHSQGMDSYLDTMAARDREVGRLSGRFAYAEGWRRHHHLGFSADDGDPLAEALGGACWVDPAYEATLD
ncbi:MAG: GlcNAc-PI de-N-acetylase [Lentisphaerae bacterium ADurb.BinA184]|nr:MAG: GlcNAc-PI de-N-acetylase [Lentisphaerae bacterium ADurb.BinA184]